MPRNFPLDLFEMRHHLRQMLTELRIPPLLILNQTLTVACRKQSGFEAAVLGFGLIESRRFPCVDSSLVEKHIQVEQITALESLQNTP